MKTKDLSSVEPSIEDLALVGEHIAAGKLTPVADRRYGLNDLPEAINGFQPREGRNNLAQGESPGMKVPPAPFCSPSPAGRGQGERGWPRPHGLEAVKKSKHLAQRRQVAKERQVKVICFLCGLRGLCVFA